MKVVAVGVSSLHPDENQDGGEGISRHVFFGDLDSPLPSTQPVEFKRAVQAAMHEFGLRVCYVFRTLKGHHVASLDLGTRRETERFEERLGAFGRDSLHGSASYWNGHAVLRVSPKPGEPRGPVFLRAILSRSPRAEALARPWSGVHYDFLNELHDGKLPMPGPVRLRAPALGGVHLERYTTKAVAPLEVAPLV